MGEFKNRCYGCEHYDGGFATSGTSSIRCAIGHKGVSVSSGCDDFKPDNTANCFQSCYYYYIKQEGNLTKHHCSAYDTSWHPYVNDSFPGKDGYCPRFAHKDSSSEKEKKSGCFVTTAVCEILGRDDNCYELETLRSFRDLKLLKDEHLQRLVYEYYDISPKFVDTIEQHPEKEKFSQYLLDNHIQKIISCIEKGDDDKAIELYQNMLQDIEQNN